MKTFKQFLLEMSTDDALKVFDLQGKSYSQETLKQAYKTLALKHHPDKGGSLEMMKQVNAAYDMLKGTSHQQKDMDDFRARYQADIAKSKEKGQAIIDKLSQKFTSDVFQKHFEGIFGEPFETKIDKTKPTENYGMTYSVWLSAEFFNQDRSIVFYLQVSASTSQKGGLPSAEQEMSMGVWTEILYKRKKIKLQQKQYNSSESYSILSDPEKVFPKAKIIEKTGKPTKPMKKADVLLTFSRELQGKQDGDFFRIPLANEYVLTIYRTVFMKQGAWGVNGLYKKFKRVSSGASVSFLERDDIVHWMTDEFKNLQKIVYINDEQYEGEVIAALNRMAGDYRTRFK